MEGRKDGFKRSPKETRRFSPKRPNRITLNMIVKNEASIITRCLDSVKGIIDDFVILDTGSTDNTIAVIRDYFKTHNIQGNVIEGTFIDFATTRNEALSYCEGKDYILLMDAHLMLTVNPTFNKSKLIADAYFITQVYDNLKYDNIRLIRWNPSFKFLGVVHEYLDTNVGITDHLEDLTLIYDAPGDKTSKSEWYASLLELGLQTEPLNTRYMFYLAQTYKDLANYPRALYWYKKRIDSIGWVEERYMSCVGAIICMSNLEHSTSDVIGLTLYAQKLIPYRCEAVYEMMKYIRCIGNAKDQEIAYAIGQEFLIEQPEHSLFVDTDVYKWRYIDELSILAFLTGDKDNYRLLIHKLLEDKVYSTTDTDRILRNAEFIEQPETLEV